jgi:hypothetical protein
MPNAGQPPQMQSTLYDTVNCDYEPPQHLQQQQQQQQQNQNQNFGNPYDCPENMYGGSMMSSVGYSKVGGGQVTITHT